MKKIMIAVGCLAMTFATASLSFGVQLSPEAAASLKTSLNGAYVTNVAGTKITYTDESTAYSPTTLDKILKGYGLSLENSKAGTLPADYATVKDGKVNISGAATAFTPVNYDAIFKAYGLVLDANCIRATIGKIPYALSVGSDGKVVLSETSTAFTGTHLDEILACYNLPAKSMMKVAPAPKMMPVIVASDYLFDFDKAVIKKKYYSKLDKVADMLKKDSSLKAEIQGNTDSIGTAKYNMGLSKRRANAVREYLIKKDGIAPDRLTAVGFGESRPIASNKTREGRAKNRRVEIKILH